MLIYSVFHQYLHWLALSGCLDAGWLCSDENCFSYFSFFDSISSFFQPHPSNIVQIVLSVLCFVLFFPVKSLVSSSTFCLRESWSDWSAINLGRPADCPWCHKEQRRTDAKWFVNARSMCTSCGDEGRAGKGGVWLHDPRQAAAGGEAAQPALYWASVVFDTSLVSRLVPPRRLRNGSPPPPVHVAFITNLRFHGIITLGHFISV